MTEQTRCAEWTNGMCICGKEHGIRCNQPIRQKADGEWEHYRETPSIPPGGANNIIIDDLSHPATPPVEEVQA